jgi:hypothetical protein
MPSSSFFWYCLLLAALQPLDLLAPERPTTAASVSSSKVVGASSLPLLARIARNFSAELKISKLPRWCMDQKPLPANSVLRGLPRDWRMDRLRQVWWSTAASEMSCVASRRACFVVDGEDGKKGTLMECCFRLPVAWLDSRVPVMNFGTSGLWGFR